MDKGGTTVSIVSTSYYLGGSIQIWGSASGTGIKHRDLRPTRRVKAVRQVTPKCASQRVKLYN